jgi:SAM-dependent methyltransferase
MHNGEIAAIGVNSACTYRKDQTYHAFLHRELSVSWLVLATLLGGRHRLELHGGRFSYLEIGCGYGLNLLFNAAAHPEAHFFGIDINPTHIAEAQSWARELGLSNVSFAVEDLRNFAVGRPVQGPCQDWPDQLDFVAAHGVATWIGEAEREALIQAASSLLCPGGLFYCSYNTYPGWLARSTLNMLSLEYGLLKGSNTSIESVLAAANTLAKLTQNDEELLPLDRELSSLRNVIKGLDKHNPAYLTGEYHAGHQPVYVGPLHRQCKSNDLTYVGTASLSEQFTGLLDPHRRAMIEQTEDPILREVVFDLAICQSFRRDLFARGVRNPTTQWRRERLMSTVLIPRSGQLSSTSELTLPMGSIKIEPEFCQALASFLSDGEGLLGDFMPAIPLELEAILSRLAIMLDIGLIGFGKLADLAGHASPEQVTTFNQQALGLITNGTPLGGVLSPLLLQPLPLSVTDAFFVQAACQGFGGEEGAGLVWLGMTMAGATLKDQEGEPIDDDAIAIAQLSEYWNEFAAQKLEELRRTGVVAL